MFAALKRYPPLAPLLGFGLGIMLASCGRAPPTAKYAAGVLMASSGAALLLPRWRTSWRIFFLFCFFLGLGWWRLENHFWKPMPVPLEQWIAAEKPRNILIQAKGYCRTEGKGSSFEGLLLGWFEKGFFYPGRWKLRFSVGSPRCPAVPGKIFRTQATLKMPGRFLNPSSMDFPRYLRSRGIWAVAVIRGEEWLIPIEGSESKFSSLIRKIRKRLEQSLKQAIAAPESLGILAALFLGEKNFLSPEVEETFRRTGLSHLLVVSGLHLALIYGIFFYPFYLIFSCHRRGSNGGWSRRLALLAAMGPTWVYAQMVGFSPSVLRAMAFAGFSGLAFLIQCRKNFFSLFLLTGLVLLLWKPFFIFDISFQLSFLSVGVLSIFGSKFHCLFNRRTGSSFDLRHRLVRWALISFFTTVVVQAVLFPLLAAYFHQVSLIAPLANLIFVPLVGLVLLPGLVLGGILLGIHPVAAGNLFHLLGWISQEAYQLISFLSELPGAFLLIKPMPLWGWGVYIFLLFSLFQLENSRRMSLFFIGALCLLGIFLWWPVSAEPLTMELLLVDVGQGESMVLKLPHGEALVIDGGGFPYNDFDMGKNVVGPELLFHGISRLRSVVLTHGDADHYKGLYYLVGHFPVEEVWLGPGETQNPKLSELVALIRRREIPLRELNAGKEWREDGVHFQVLWPPRRLLSAPSEDWSENNRGLVLRVCYRDVCLLLTGDTESEVEQALVESGTPLGSQVLKLGHHGSGTSTTETFLQKVHPQLTLASLGKKNRFGFPHQGVLEALKRLGLKLLRTDRHGEIRVMTDGENIFYRTFSGEEGYFPAEGPVGRGQP